MRIMRIIEAKVLDISGKKGVIPCVEGKISATHTSDAEEKRMLSTSVSMVHRHFVRKFYDCPRVSYQQNYSLYKVFHKLNVRGEPENIRSRLCTMRDHDYHMILVHPDIFDSLDKMPKIQGVTILTSDLLFEYTNLIDI